MEASSWRSKYKTTTSRYNFGCAEKKNSERSEREKNRSKRRLEVDVRWYNFRWFFLPHRWHATTAISKFVCLLLAPRKKSVYFSSLRIFWLNLNHSLVPGSLCVHRGDEWMNRTEKERAMQWSFELRRRKIQFHSRLRERELQECIVRNFYDCTLMMFTSRSSRGLLLLLFWCNFRFTPTKLMALLPLTLSIDPGKKVTLCYFHVSIWPLMHRSVISIIVAFRHETVL